MDIRTYPHDADSDVDAEQMTHFNLADELNARAAENERLRNELASIEEKFRVALGGYHDSNLLSLAESLRKFNEYHSDRIDDATEERDRLRAENVRLDCELRLRIQQLMDTSRAVGQLLTANETLRDNAAELSKALDMCIAERDGAFAEVDAQTLKANSFRGELHRYMQHAIELKDMLDISVAERDALRAELDNERNAHNATAAQLYAELAGAQDTVTSAAQAWRTVTDERDALRAELDTQAKRHAEIIDQWKAEENMWRYYDKKQLAQIDALRAELDAMRQAHSVIAARMEAMGC